MKTMDLKLVEKLLKYKLTKEQVKILREKYPKGSIKNIDDLIDLMEMLAEMIEIDGKKLIEDPNWDLYITFYLYFRATQDTFFALGFSSQNLQQTLSMLEEQLELLKTIMESEQVKKMIEERQKEIREEINEKKEENSQLEQYTS